MEKGVPKLTGVSGGESANGVCRTSKSLGFPTVIRSPIVRDSLALYRVYTGQQIWEQVSFAGIEDALDAVRLGNLYELGEFLGNDMLKGRNPVGCSFWYKMSDFPLSFLLCSRRSRQDVCYVER